MPDSRGEQDLRFVDQAFAFMLAKYVRQNASAKDLEAKLFGGADIFRRDKQAPVATAGLQVGRQNVAAALRAIEAAGLRLSVSDVGGGMARKLLFHTHSGEVLLKRFPLTEGVDVCRD